MNQLAKSDLPEVLAHFHKIRKPQPQIKVVSHGGYYIGIVEHQLGKLAYRLCAA